MSKKVSIYPKLCNTFNSAVQFYFIFTSLGEQQNFQHFALLVADDFFMDQHNLLVFGYSDHDQALNLKRTRSLKEVKTV